MNNKLLISFLLILSFSLNSALAERKMNSRSAKIIGLANYTSQINELINNNKNNDFKPIRLTAFVPSLGRVKIKLNKKKYRDIVPTFTSGSLNINDDNKIILYRGELKSKKETTKIAASIFFKNEIPYLFINFKGNNYRLNRGKYYRIQIPLIKGTIAKVSKSTSLDFECDQEIVEKAITTSSLNTSSAYKIAEISVDADKKFYQLHGNSSNNLITSFIDFASNIYENQLGIALKIVRQNTFTNKTFGDSDPNNIIHAYREYTIYQSYLSDADIHHLITGTNIDSSTIGIAFNDVTCLLPNYAFGVTQYTNSELTPVTIAHELGHNFGANHSSSGIMGTVISFPYPTTFSNLSLNEISSFLSTNDYCLPFENFTDNNPAPTNPGESDPNEDLNPPNDPDQNIPMFNSFLFKLKKSGIISGLININQTNNQCQLELYGHKSKSNISQKGILLYSEAISKNTFNFSGKLKRKALSENSSGVILKYFIQAKINCGSDSNLSSIKRLKNAHRIKSSKEPLKPKRWIKHFKKFIEVL